MPFPCNSDLGSIQLTAESAVPLAVGSLHMQASGWLVACLHTQHSGGLDVCTSLMQSIIRLEFMKFRVIYFWSLPILLASNYSLQIMLSQVQIIQKLDELVRSLQKQLLQCKDKIEVGNKTAVTLTELLNELEHQQILED